MKLRSRFALPPLDRSSMLPLALAALLCAAVAFQALIGSALDLPAVGPVRGASPARLVADRPPVAIAVPATNVRSIFTPILSPPKEAAAGSQAPLGGYSVLGVIQIGRATFAVVRGPGERTLRAGPGQRIGEWRVHRVTRDEVRLVRGGERMTVRFGPSGPVTTAAGKGV
ncbi:hypothetical protein E5A73_20595 [Sphingomonas gei]|uniref:Type II secretion system protein GspC N-terminal domain-containing protein n=1 Tax=Sphingomonas gei TaxID=1395960 RepID=A0A4S1X197_9SPHN|nr:hypothetical protein [Sphingomonas gei]TGX48707.1 hypothetical protein E5A73_20595 [Sphingomonas gei]